MGYSVSSLTIIDSEAPTHDNETAREHDRIDVLMKWVGALELLIERSLNIKEADLEFRSETAQRELLHLRMMSFGLMPPRSRPETLTGPLRTFASSLRTQYRPDQIYTGQVRLIAADDPRVDSEVNRLQHERVLEAWRQWTPTLTFAHIPGNTRI